MYVRVRDHQTRRLFLLSKRYFKAKRTSFCCCLSLRVSRSDAEKLITEILLVSLESSGHFKKVGSKLFQPIPPRKGREHCALNAKH
jgi:hypothetical protein